MAEFEIKGVNYRAGKIPARIQFHLTRKLSPLLPGLVPLVFSVIKGGGPKQGEPASLVAIRSLMADPDGMAKLIAPVADAFAALPDDHADFIIDTCLSVVARQQGNSWASAMASNGAMMFDDMDLPTIMQVVVRVLTDNLGNFIPGLHTSQTVAGDPSAA
ncbi:phage tail assembly chaperone [Microvirgula aerodenitrificans]|uniref:phage tail assembly chaperone n=1 Tax=Microvirgula aerodenitrificans TaxID=57480 RepID=UPI00248D9581|nr:hypothetical protein [Microvirgula aerodenitrificans]